MTAKIFKLDRFPPHVSTSFFKRLGMANTKEQVRSCIDDALITANVVVPYHSLRDLAFKLNAVHGRDLWGSRLIYLVTQAEGREALVSQKGNALVSMIALAFLQSAIILAILFFIVGCNAPHCSDDVYAENDCAGGCCVEGLEMRPPMGISQ